MSDNTEWSGRIKGEVYRHQTSRETIVIAGPITAAETAGPEWVKIADTPHEDNDFSYTCNSDYCRCLQ